jgi:cytochrome b
MGVTEEKRLVWDLPLRVFHWLFALSIAASWATAKAGFEYMQYHFYLGYWMIGLVVFRVIWGFIGPRHARFSNFLHGPSTLLKYFRSLTGGEPLITPGHNPAGGLMVIVMMAMVALQAGTGLFATDDIAWSGPYNPAVDGSLAGKLTSLHHANFNWILGAIALHLLAIGFYWLVKKQNLVVPMFTGHKPAAWVAEHEAITSSELMKALIVILISSGLVYWLIGAAPEPVDTYSF